VRKGPLQDVVAVRHLGGHRLWLRFEDGVEGELDLRDVVGEFTGVLEPLADPKFVGKVFIQPDFKTITWPGELDLDKVVLYCAVKGVPVPECGAPESKATRRSSGRARGAATRSGKRRRQGAA